VERVVDLTDVVACGRIARWSVVVIACLASWGELAVHDCVDSEPEDDEVRGGGLDDEVGVPRSGGGRVAVTCGDHLVLIAQCAVQDVEELGVGVLVGLTAVAASASTSVT
jgi:hypothetical protein